MTSYEVVIAQSRSYGGRDTVWMQTEKCGSATPSGFRKIEDLNIWSNVLFKGEY